MVLNNESGSFAFEECLRRRASSNLALTGSVGSRGGDVLALEVIGEDGAACIPRLVGEAVAKSEEHLLFELRMRSKARY